MAEQFPTSLSNKKPLIENFAFTPGQNKVEITTQGGTLLSRKRAVKPQDSMRLSFNFSKTELDTFRDFYDTTLDGGTKSFNMTHPIDLNEVEVRIVGVPAYSVLGPSDFQANFGVIILQENN